MFSSGPHEAVLALSFNITAAITEAQHVRDFHVLLFYHRCCQVTVANQNIKGLGLNLSTYLPCKNSVCVTSVMYCTHYSPFFILIKNSSQCDILYLM